MPGERWGNGVLPVRNCRERSAATGTVKPPRAGSGPPASPLEPAIPSDPPFPAQPPDDGPGLRPDEAVVVPVAGGLPSGDPPIPPEAAPVPGSVAEAVEPADGKDPS